MKAHGPRDGTSGATDVQSEQATSAAADFAWPPTPADLDRCSIVSLSGDADEEARLRVLVRMPDVLPPAATQGAPRRPARRPASLAAGGRHWGVEQPAAAYPFHVDGDDPMAAASAGSEVRRAAVAVAAGLSLAVLSYVQFRSVRTDAAALVTAVAQATVSADRHGPDPVMEIPQLVADQIAPPASLERRIVERASTVSASDAGVGTKLARLASGVIDEVRATNAVDVLPASPAITAAPPVEPTLATRTPPAGVELAAADLPAATAAAAPVAVTAAVHVDPVVEPVRGDEDRIRAALTQWRTAYSSLDAGAAREIWPSVDARALQRAFQDLKSQDLRFDRCNLTVDGGRAQAACSGRAIYVPRVGNQSPKAMPREWTFELTKQDQRWTIASARAS